MISNEIIFAIRDVLICVGQFDFVIRVGLERNRDSDEVKIDFLVGGEGLDPLHYFSQIQAAPKNRWPDAKLFTSDDAVRFDLGTSSGSITVCDSVKFVEQIKEWIGGKNLAGQRRSWAIDYWFPEALCGDLATAKVLHDIKATYAEIKNLIVPYPELLSRVITTLCVDEIRQKMDKLGQTKDSAIESAFCLSDIGAAMIRLAFARSRYYLRGFSSLAEQAVFLQPSDLTLYKLASNLLREKEVIHVLEEIRKKI